jgi:hypothetical protein
MRRASVAVVAVLALLLVGCGGTSTVTVSESTPLPIVFTAAEHAGQSCEPASEHPSELKLSCGMGFALSQLNWHHWGEPVSYAEGTAEVSDCEPDCEEGKIKDVRIQVVVSLIETCTNGQRRYTELTWSFPGGWPSPPTEGEGSQEVRVPCPAA